MVANSPNTIKRYRQRYLKYLEPSILNKKKIGQIDELLLEGARNQITNRYEIAEHGKSLQAA